MNRIEREKKTVRHMIELWCRHNHGGDVLCEDCRVLCEYSEERLMHCKFGERKTKCHKCTVHCYKPEMREKIRAVMRYSGPRIIFHHPIEAIRFLLSK